MDAGPSPRFSALSLTALLCAATRSSAGSIRSTQIRSSRADPVAVGAAKAPGAAVTDAAAAAPLDGALVGGIVTAPPEVPAGLLQPIASRASNTADEFRYEPLLTSR